MSKTFLIDHRVCRMTGGVLSAVVNMIMVCLWCRMLLSVLKFPSCLIDHQLECWRQGIKGDALQLLARTEDKKNFSIRKLEETHQQWQPHISFNSLYLCS